MAMNKRYDHANEKRYHAAIEALDAASKTSSNRYNLRDDNDPINARKNEEVAAVFMNFPGLGIKFGIAN